MYCSQVQQWLQRAALLDGHRSQRRLDDQIQLKRRKHASEGTLMKIARSSISHFFCIAPEHFSSTTNENTRGLLAGMSTGRGRWEHQLGIAPPADAINVGAYSDNSRLSFDLIKQSLHQLGIWSNPKGDPSVDPSVVVAITDVTGSKTSHNAYQLLIGVAYGKGAAIQQCDLDNPITYY
jgi:hypothetical protein